MSADFDVIVIGAGVAGLAALADLQRAGKRAICFEARARIGGRIYTVYDPLCAVPVELGAEFIHGRPPEVWNVVRDNTLTAYDCTEHSLHLYNGQVEQRSDAWLMVEDILSQMRQAANAGPDQSFNQFLATVNQPEPAKDWARSFVEGFNAADANLVSIAALAEESRASRAIDGDRSFRILNGYHAVPSSLARGCQDIRLNTIVEGIGWSHNSVSVHTRSALSGEIDTHRARRALLTIPLGVLQTGGIRFDPQPAQALHAAKRLCFGQVVRLITRFRRAVWEENPDFADAGFMLSRSPLFRAWWSCLPIRVPVLVAWCAGPRANALAACQPADVVGRALGQLSQMTGIPDYQLHAELEQVYYHDWSKDPFSRGAYSYAPSGAAGAREQLATPVEDTLFFAGEATDVNGHAATVHGAIASGRRAAAQILAV